MALPRAVIATASASRGISLPGAVTIADGEEEFSRAVVSLLKDSALRQKTAIAGRQAIETVYDWATLASRYENVYYGLLNN